ncbi:hypothetical protein V6N13_124518 [Hibiscus sabdariffa]
MQLPVYQTINEGLGHAPKFKSTMLVDDVTYTSESSFSNVKAAGHDVAKHVLECISKKIKDEGCLLLHVDCLPFLFTLVFNDETYKGETGRNKNEAEQLAARAVIQPLLANDRYEIVVSEIIRSKAKLHNAWNKEVETTTITNRLPTSASLHPSSQAKHPRHKFKTPPSKQGTRCNDLPNVFVHAVFVDALDAGESCLRM